MRRVAQRRRFRDDLKRQKRRGKDISDFIAAVELLAEHGTFTAPAQCRQAESEITAGMPL
jgi:hypothetical protein